MRIANFEFDPRVDKLGEGPQSEVFRATDTRLERTVALKILRSHVEIDPEATERFKREAKHASHFSHPNIATVYEYGRDDGTSYIAMEYLEGRSLDKIIKERALGYEEGVRIALQVVSALAMVHEQGVVHRDLKPGNIMVLADGTVKLLDFGICRSMGESNITQQGILVGTVLYMAPEQILGDPLDARTDVFALGSAFYHAFLGSPPFPGASFPEVCMAILESRPGQPSEKRTTFPRSLEAFLLKALSRDPDARFPHGGAAYGALLAVADGLKLESVARSAPVRGRIVIPPLALVGEDDEARQFAAGVVSDLSTELGRSTELEILSNGQDGPEQEDAFVLRGSLDLAGETAVIDYVLERARFSEGSTETDFLLRDRIEHSDSDEWGLQAKLVGSLVRTLKRRLPAYGSPEPKVEGDPEKARALARRAHVLLHRGTTRHLMMAISTFRTALQEDGRCALAHAGMAEALVRKYLYWNGDVSFFEEALESARRALAFDPLSAEAHTSLGIARAMTGDTTEAQREFRLAIQMDHEEWLAHGLLGALLARLGNHAGASPLLRRALALRPAHVASHGYLYAVLCRLDRYQEAIEVADRGIEIARRHLARAPDDQDTRLHLASLHARMGSAEEARLIVGEAKKRAPKDPSTCYRSAVVYALLGDSEAALALLREAQERGYHLPAEIPHNPDLDLLRGRPEFQALVR